MKIEDITETRKNIIEISDRNGGLQNFSRLSIFTTPPLLPLKWRDQEAEDRRLFAPGSPYAPSIFSSAFLCTASRCRSALPTAKSSSSRAFFNAIARAAIVPCNISRMESALPLGSRLLARALMAWRKSDSAVISAVFLRLAAWAYAFSSFVSAAAFCRSRTFSALLMVVTCFTSSSSSSYSFRLLQDQEDVAPSPYTQKKSTTPEPDDDDG